VDVLNEVIAICNVIGQQAITRGGGLATATPPAVAATPSGAVAAGSYTSMYLASSQQAQVSLITKRCLMLYVNLKSYVFMCR
jgi:hypothetical protein